MQYLVLLIGDGELPAWDSLSEEEQYAGMQKFEAFDAACEAREGVQVVSSAALGGPLPWVGKDMRKAHADLEIKEEHFNAIAENLVATLKDLKISDEMIGKVIAVVATTKDDVLNRPKKAE